MLLVLRPFRVGESIETGNVSGTIVDVGLFATELRTPEGVYRLAPNSTLWNVPITNYSRLATRRHEITIAIGANDDIESTETALVKLAAADSRVLKNPKPTAYVSEFDAGGAKITVRYWINGQQWWDVSRDMMKAVKHGFDKKASEKKAAEAMGEASA
jgi:small conductance mechanosensitive channel